MSKPENPYPNLSAELDHVPERAFTRPMPALDPGQLPLSQAAQRANAYPGANQKKWEETDKPRTPPEMRAKPTRGRPAMISHQERDSEPVRFHCWGYRTLKGTEPPIVETVAVVERETGHVKLYHPERLTFTDGGAA